MTKQLNSIVGQLNIDPNDCQYHFDLVLERVQLNVRCNTQELVIALQEYFSAYIPLQGDFDQSFTLFMVESTPVEQDLSWNNWPRELGKRGLKDSYIDVDGGRWLRKIKTGMVYFQGNDCRLAIGPCLANFSQVVNYLINQYMNYLQQDGALICHAAALSLAGRGVAIAAFSGGGKSTTMLKLLDQENAKFVSNDRLFIHQKDGQCIARGVPKLPRVNPGTLLHNPKLKSILSNAEQARLSALPKAELWDLEQKYDVMVASVYGENKIQVHCELQDLLLLNWHRDNTDQTHIEAIDIATRPDLIAAIAKSPGPFYQNNQGDFLMDPSLPEDQRYIDALKGVNVYEVSGCADFNKLVELYLAKIEA